mmetsp:Transcript_3592/g.5581  ORF Transcript_3592/g.5581 Transcript_3592/m.5581 type:complete len:231 (-) Transcript_3592:108-800(-)
MSSEEEDSVVGSEEEEEESSVAESVEEEEEESEEEESEEEEKVVVVKKRKPAAKGGKKKKDPNKPKRNMSAFFLFSNANRQRVKEENPEAKFGDIAKIMSVQFKALPEKEAKRWEKKAMKDKIRYQNEMKSYTPPDESSDSESDDAPKKKAKKAKKDPNKPKRNQSAFFLYSNDVRSRVRQENPEAAFGDIAKLISKEFKALASKERKVWDKKAAKDKERYQREMADYAG